MLGFSELMYFITLVEKFITYLLYFTRTNFALPLQIIGFKAFKLRQLWRDYLLWETIIVILFAARKHKYFEIGRM